MYQKAAHRFLLLCQQEKIDFTTVRVLEIGCGNGFYAQLLQDQGVKNYLGVDITDIFFSDFVERFPGFQFIRRDITADSITGKFDLILMIDVIEHIVGEEKLSIALNNIKTVIDDNGLFLLAPILEKGRCSLFNVRFWTTSDIKRRLLGFQFGELIQFRYSYLLPARKLSQVDLSSHIRD